ncbi:hypothetical protein [Wolbachia endosymbiont (group A) of Trypoxylon clavicerum]|nr:hypothetical protein [Wolbachia endosymbiont (group A) of Trypoxylon clavicerum]
MASLKFCPQSLGLLLPFFLLGKFLNIYGNMNWAGRCHSSA